jgi:hypothetical protein
MGGETLLDNLTLASISDAMGTSLESKIMFLGCVIGRRSITIRLPPSGLAKNLILDSTIYFYACFPCPRTRS